MSKDYADYAIKKITAMEQGNCSNQGACSIPCSERPILATFACIILTVAYLPCSISGGILNCLSCGAFGKYFSGPSSDEKAIMEELKSSLQEGVIKKTTAQQVFGSMKGLFSAKDTNADAIVKLIEDTANDLRVVSYKKQLLALASEIQADANKLSARNPMQISC